MYITASSERLQICVNIFKKPLQVAGTTLRPLFLLHKLVRETRYNVNFLPSRQDLSSMLENITEGHLLICDGWFDTWIVQKSKV